MGGVVGWLGRETGERMKKVGFRGENSLYT